ncbi:hypothetical protein PC121_g579 [Phytophthora cactorum]|nr:hypothetical protein PC120_g700 [Phytophthora cactorum]KAG3104848.1 hypothetical protein PC121_g579 [Phytophthora cactorum]
MGEAFPVDIDTSLSVGHLKDSIKAKKPNDLKDVDANRLQLYLAKANDGAWLPSDDPGARGGAPRSGGPLYDEETEQSDLQDQHNIFQRQFGKTTIGPGIRDWVVAEAPDVLCAYIEFRLGDVANEEHFWRTLGGLSDIEVLAVTMKCFSNWWAILLLKKSVFV